MQASYFDPRSEQTVETDVGSRSDIARLAEVVVQLKSQRGVPSIEIVRGDGSSLTLSFKDERAFLVWSDSLGTSYHSLGGRYEDDLVFDYFGSWSEAPSEFLIPFDLALDAAAAFLAAGSPVTESVQFSLD